MGERRLHVSASALDAGAATVQGEQHHYLFRVLRLAVGDELVVFDGHGREANAIVESVSAQQATLRLGDARETDEARGPRMIAMPALIKGERMEWCVQKLVELGVSTIAPVRAARSVVKLDAKRAANRRSRFEGIASNAARQCGRSTVPDIRPIGSLAEAIGSLEAELKLVFTTALPGRGLAEVLAGAQPSSVAFAIGPEGGFTPDEVEGLVEAGFVAVGLGPRVLRAETAAVAALAALSYALGDLGNPGE